jgi:predicted nucleotidyltransferase
MLYWVQGESLKEMKVVHPSREEARHLADRCAKLLREQFGVQRVILFGSAAGDAPWHSRSDLDLVVEGLRPENHLAALNSCYELLPPGLELDLIPVESAWPELRARIEGEIKMPEEPMEALAFEIQNELHNLERVVEELTEFLQDAPVKPPKIQIQGTAKYLHDFYNGVERIFERIAVRLDEDVPAGFNWHTLLLQRMGQPFGSRRSAVIDRPLEIELSEYLRFRHLFRHTYGYDLEWERVQELGQALPDVLRTLKTQVETFLSALAATEE